MNSASYCKTCNISCSVQSFDFNMCAQINKFQMGNHDFFGKKKKHRQHYARRTSIMFHFLFALSLMPLCQMQHPPITLSQAVYSSRYYFACNKSLPLRGNRTELQRPLDVSASSHEFNRVTPWKIMRNLTHRERERKKILWLRFRL